MAEFPTFKHSWPWPWIGSYCIPPCITHRPLPTHQMSLKSKKLFVDGRTYGHLRPTLLGRLGGVDLNIIRDHLTRTMQLLINQLLMKRVLSRILTDSFARDWAQGSSNDVRTSSNARFLRPSHTWEDHLINIFDTTSGVNNSGEIFSVLYKLSQLVWGSPTTKTFSRPS